MPRSGFIAMVGLPNAGKSTLMNRLVGEKLSIVTPKPQTTRKRVMGIYSDSDTQLVFVDTPGMIDPKYEMQRSMMEYVAESLESADAVCLIIELASGKTSGFRLHERILKFITHVKQPIICLLNKTDLIHDKKELLPVMQHLTGLKLFKEVIPVSALKNDNIDTIIPLLAKYVPENQFYYDPELLSTQPQRFFVSEMIREIVFNRFREEIPYSTDVSVVEFKEREGAKWYIHAEIIVERDSQKKIIIGDKGSEIKMIGKLSRESIEDYLGVPVYLELFVKVRDNWRNKRGMLRSLGY